MSSKVPKYEFVSTTSWIEWALTESDQYHHRLDEFDACVVEGTRKISSSIKLKFNTAEDMCAYILKYGKALI